MVTVTVREVQHHLAALLERVERGESVEIRRRQRPVARLVPISDAEYRAELTVVTTPARFQGTFARGECYGER